VSQEEKRDNENQNNKKPVENNDNNSPFRSGGFRSRGLLDTSLWDTDNNPTHILFKNVPMPPNPEADKNSTNEKKTKPEKDVGHS
jgi:hypothetical protein